MTEHLFSSERLIGRRLTLDDVPAMMAIYGDVETVRFVGDGEPLSQSECVRWIEVTDTNFERRGYGMVGLIDESGLLVGCIGIVHPGQQVEPEVKYAFHREVWGRGLATEAVRAILAWHKDQGHTQPIIATVAPGNASSQNVLRKNNFRLKETLTNDDGSETQVWMSS